MVALMAGGGSGGVVSRGKAHVTGKPKATVHRATLLAFKSGPGNPPIPASDRPKRKTTPAPRPSKSALFPSIGKTGKTGGIAIPVGGFPWTPAPTPSGPGRASIPHPAPAVPVYANPLRAITGLVPERIDQGVDYAGRGPIYAPGPGTIVYSGVGNQTGWGPPNNGIAPGGFVSERLASGPAKGQIVYFAEGITPTVRPGQKVGTKTVIANMSAPIETGFASGVGTQPEAQAAGELSGPTSTAWGNAWSKVLHALGAPAGIVQPGGVGPGNVPDFTKGLKAGSPGRVTLPPSLPPIVIPSGVNPPASGGVAMPPARLAAATTPTKAKAKRLTSSPLHVKPTGPPVASPTGTTGTSTGTTTITSVTSSTAPPTFINSSTGTGGITPLAQPVASGTTGAKSSTSTLLLVAGAGVILVVILMSKKGKK